MNEAIKHGIENNIELKSFKYKIKQSESNIDRVNGDFLPTGEIKAGVGPSPRRTGNYLNSETNYDKWGASVLTSIEVKYPIFTWNKKKDYLNASKDSVSLSKVEFDEKKNEIINNIKNAYLNALYTYSLMDFVNGLKEKIESAKKKTKGKNNRYILNIIEGKVLAKEIEILKGNDYALKALQVYSGYEKEIIPQKDWIERANRELKALKYYQDLASNNMFDLKKLEIGISAKQNLLKAETKNYLPSFGLFLKYDYLNTRNSDKQSGAFSYDPYNKSNLLVGIGLLWNLDFFVTKSKINKLKAEVMELETKKKYAQTGFPLLVYKAWNDVKTTTKLVKVSNKAYKNAKKLMTRMTAGALVGTTSGKELFNNIELYASALNDYYKSILDNHLAWAHLSQVVGVDIEN